MRDLAVQGSSETNNPEARGAIEAEALALGKELNRVAEATNFNRIDVLKGGALAIQVGTGSDVAKDVISVSLGDVEGVAGVNDGTTLLSDAAGATGFKVDTAANRTLTIDAIDVAIENISKQRAELGSTQNRLEHTIKSLNVAGENLQAAQSRIADVDMAQEMVKFTKANILSQAGTAMLAQANQSSQGVLSLLR